MKKAAARLLVLLAVVLSVRYFWWRFLHTKNPLAIWFFYLFLAAELLNFLEATLFYFTTWKLTERKAAPPLRKRTVDVFIATYNEPVSLLRETLVCAVSMRYPHKTYILDDGNRPEVRELAEVFGCGYISRTERTHAKAGNLNNALKLTAGEFIVTLDADHAPMPDLIDQLIGFFADPKIAAVQSPQDFYNLDSFQHVTHWKKRYTWQQQELFFSVIQPGKDAYNAAFYCGSPAMLRRQALEAIDGFAVESITEDMHTGLRLQKKGWRVIYYNRTLARGLAPQTFAGFATQWQRWGRGAMQVLREENPLFSKGLDLGQRLCYFSSFYFYWMSFQKLIYVLTPVFCLLSGVFPLVAEPRVFIRYFGPYFVLNTLASSLLQGGAIKFLLSEQFNLLKIPLLIGSVRGLFDRQARFSVTPKAQSAAASWKKSWPLLAILVGLAVALAVGSWRLLQAKPGYPFWAVTVNLFCALFYVSLLAPIVWRAKKRRELRGAYRFRAQLNIPAQFDFINSDGSVIRAQSFVRNLNRHGISVTHSSAIPVGTLTNIELGLPHRTIFARGQVVHNQEYRCDGQTCFANGVRFEKIDPTDQDAISTYLICELAPRDSKLLRLTQMSQILEPIYAQFDAEPVQVPAARGASLSRANY